MKTITEMGMSKKDRKGYLDKIADMLPDFLGGKVVKAKRKRKRKLGKPLT